MNNLPQDLVLRHEEIPDDEALLDELIALVDRASPTGLSRSPPEKSRKNVKKIISGIVFYGLLLSLIAGAFFLSQGEKKPILGYSFMNVLTWSMEPEIPQGSLVIIKSIDPNEISIGDDITFTIDPQTSVTHRVIGIMEDYENSGARGFETQGIDNDTPDFDIVPAINVVGVVKFHVPKLGGWLDWLGSNLLLVGGFFIGIILLIFLLKGALRKPPKPQNTQVYTGSKGETRVNKTTHSERESNHMKGKFRRILYSSGAIVVATALAVGGTFAYRNWERKSNVVTGKAQYQARLVENYDKNPEWDPEIAITKEVFVRNMGGVGQYKGKNWGDIYVGIRLLEYLDITPYTYEYITGRDIEEVGTGTTPIRFMVDTNGEFVRFPVSKVDFTETDEAELRKAIAAAYPWQTVITDATKREAFIDSLIERDANNKLKRDFYVVSGLYDKNEAGYAEDYYYLPTIEGDPNGQYGAYVVKSAVEDTANSRAITVAEDKPMRLTANGQEKASEAEYLKHYQPHLWGDGAEESLVHEYITVVLGDHKKDWVFYTEWEAGIETEGGVWILDNRPGSVGWAYWSEPLPKGQDTDLLIKELQPQVVPEESIYYDLYVMMEAYSKDEVPNTWPTYVAPAQVFRVTPDGGTLAPSGTMNFNSTLDGVDATEATEWRLYDEPMVYDPDTQGITPMSVVAPNITAGGSTITGTSTITLTAGAEETAEKLYILAIHGNNWKQIEIEIKDDSDSDLLDTKHKDNPNYAYESLYDSNTEPITDFTKLIAVNNDGSIDTSQVGQHDGSIPLKDILTSGPYDNTVSVDILDTAKFAPGDIFIAEDPRNGNEWSIFYSYYPKSKTEMDAIGTWTSGNTIGGYDALNGYNPTIKTKVKLTRGDQSAEIFIQMRYNDSTFPW